MSGQGTILGEDIQFRGEIRLKDSLLVHGSVIGQIESQGKLQVSPKGNLRADIDAVEIYLDGTIHGNVHARKKIELRKSSHLVGDIRTADLKVDSGSSFSGTCVMA